MTEAITLRNSTTGNTEWSRQLAAVYKLILSWDICDGGEDEPDKTHNTQHNTEPTGETESSAENQPIPGRS